MSPVHPHGPVADGFLARLAAAEDVLLGPLGGALGGEQGASPPGAGGVLAALAVPARPRSHRALQGVPAAQAQDPGLHRARGRPLPHAADAHDRGDRHLAHGRARAAPERGSDRGDRTRPRPRPPALRPRGRGGARRQPCTRASASGFRHNEHSLRVVDHLERDGRGLNLTHEVRDGILHHTGPTPPESLEGRIVRIVDRVAYINHDIDDALRAGVLTPDDLPAEPVRAARRDRARGGSTRSCTTSSRARSVAGDIVQSPRMGEAMLELRAFLFATRLRAGAAARRDRARRASSCARCSTTTAPSSRPTGIDGRRARRGASSTTSPA